MKRAALIFLAAGLVAVAYLARRHSDSGKQPASAGEPAAPAPAARAPHPGGAPARLQAALADSDPVRSRGGFLDVLRSMTKEEAATLARGVFSAAGDLQEITDRKRLFCHAWGQLDGPAALDFVRKNPGVGQVAALSQALAGWASRDPQACKGWIDVQLEPNERLMYRWALVDGWARHDPATATEFVLSQKDLPGTDRAVKTIALEQVRRDGATAGQWALTLPEGSLRQAAVEGVAQSWALSRPQDAADWGARLDNRTLAITATTRAVTEWVRTDATAAGTWLKTLQASTLRDQAVSAFIQVTGAAELENIGAWAVTISDSKVRETSLRRIAEEWMARNPQRTLAWLPQSGLSPSAQEEIRRIGN